MKNLSLYFLLIFLLFFLDKKMFAQSSKNPVAKFSFNNRIGIDEISKKEPKFIGINFCADRFGNANNAVYVFGNEFSYINLGNYPALKPKTGSISLWVNIEREVHSGRGYTGNPILLTKSRKEDDFFEAYGIYYELTNKKARVSCARDSLRQTVVTSNAEMSLFKWHHLVITYDQNYFSFYYDGELQRKEVKEFETEFLAGDSVLVGISANRKNNRYMEGAVDDIEFYDHVLSNKEVLELYNAPNPNKSKIILNWILVAITVLLAGFVLYLFIKHRLNLTLKKEKQKMELANKLLENELRINRALMNPHFIFNSLNTLHNLILTNNNDRASDYLLKFSKLIRKILDSNMSDTISLELELDLIERYLEIEGLRFKEDITYFVTLDPQIIPSTIVIPIMMIQPFVENSVWHGLREKTGEKIVTVSFFLFEEEYIRCIIEDNGTGRKKKNPGLNDKKSLAIGFVQQRLELLNKLHNLTCSLKIIDKPNGQGTIVQVILPLLNKLKHAT